MDCPHSAVSSCTYSRYALFTSTLKSYGFSLLLHASVVAALYAIPTAATKRFTQTGQKQVISIEATQARPVSTSLSYFEPLESPMISELDSPVDRLATTEPLDARELPNEPRDSTRGEVPKPSLAAPMSVPNQPIDQQLMMKRREADEIPPDPSLRVPELSSGT